MDQKIIYIVIAVVILAVAAVAIVLVSGEGSVDDSKYVTYHGNGGTYDGKDTVYSSEPKAASLNLFTKEGYHATSWNTKANGSGTTYSPGQSVSLGTHLYAQWSSMPKLVVTPNLYSSSMNMYLGQIGSNDLTLIDKGGSFEIPMTGALIVVASADTKATATVDGSSVTFVSEGSKEKVTLNFTGAKIDKSDLLSNGYSAYFTFTPDLTVSEVSLGTTVSIETITA